MTPSPDDAPRPVSLPANQPAARFYDGGARISRFRGDPIAQPHTPEDWVGSVTSVRGDAPAGLTTLPSGELLADAIARDPRAWLGAEHVASFGSDPMLLVKLLDPGQRLPIHAHPDGEFARRALAAAHGKAEAWYILEPGTVHLGLRESIDHTTLLHYIETQQTSRMLELMHEFRVGRDDTVFVPPGVLHAIGEGTFLAEVQEPEDLSILLEWDGFELDGERDGHLGLGFAVALDAVETTARTSEDARRLIRYATEDGPALAAAADPFFRLDRVSHDLTLEPSLAIVIGLEGSMILGTDGGTLTDVSAGTTTIVPAGAGTMRFTGAGTVLVARPPLPR